MVARLLSLETLTLERAVIEFRHPPAYLLWDRAGQLWYTLQKRWPTLERLEAQPNLTRFKLPPGDELAVELDRYHLVSIRPNKPMDKFADTAEAFSSDVASMLSQQSYDRVGLRLIYALECTDRDEATNLVLGKNLLDFSGSLEKAHPFPGKWVLPDVSFRWEGKALGLTHRLRVEERKTELNIPPDFPPSLNISSVKNESTFVVLDMDYYSTTKIQRGQMLVRQWIDTGHQIIRTQIERLLARK